MLDKRVTGNYNKGKKRIAIDFTKITIKKEESIMSLHSYTPEFKKKIVDIHEKDRRTYKSIADEYGVSKASISKWCSEFNKEYQRNLQIMENNDLMKENARLKQENRKLRKKIAFLKETTIFLAKEMNQGTINLLMLNEGK